MTARLVRPASRIGTRRPNGMCRDGWFCDQPATHLITADRGLKVPQRRCLVHLGMAVECIAESLAEAGHKAEIRITPISREG